MRWNEFILKEKLRRFHNRYIKFIKSPDGRVLRSNREMYKAFCAHFRDRFAHCPELPVQEFHNYLADFPRLVVRLWLRNAESVMRNALNRSASTSRRDWMVYPTRCTWGCRTCFSLLWGVCSTIDYITKKRWQACLGGCRWLQGHNSAKHKVKDFGPSLSKPFAGCYLRSEWTRAELHGREDRTGQLESGSQNHRGIRRRRWSCSDQFRSVQGLR